MPPGPGKFDAFFRFPIVLEHVALFRVGKVVGNRSRQFLLDCDAIPLLAAMSLAF